MIVSLFQMPGDVERVAITTLDNDDVYVGDVIKTEFGGLPSRWRVVALHGDEADAVACT